MAAISGHGATLGFTTSSGWTPQYTEIGGFEFSRPAIDTSHLGTDGTRTKIPGDLFDVGPFTCPFIFQPDQLETTLDNSFDDLLFDSGEAAAADTVTITYPDTASSTCGGSAFVTGGAVESLITDQLAMANISIQWSGWPAFATP